MPNLCKFGVSIWTSVWNGLKASVNLTVSAHLAYSWCLLIKPPYLRNPYVWNPPFTVQCCLLQQSLHLSRRGQQLSSAQTSLIAIYFLLTPPFICFIPDALQSLWTVTEPDVDLDLHTDTEKYTSHLKDMGEGTGGFSSALLSNGCWWRHSLWLWVMFIHSKVIGRVKMRHAQCELNQARLETAPLTSSLHLAFLYQRSLTSDPCPPPPSPSLSTKSFNPGFSVTPPFCSGVGVHVCSPALWKPAGQHYQPSLEKERGGGKEIAFSIAVMAGSIINITITTLAWAISRLQFVGFWKKHKSEGLLCFYSTEEVKSGQINSTWQKTISVDY